MTQRRVARADGQDIGRDTPLAAGRSALLVVDMQNAFCTPGCAHGGSGPDAGGDFHDRLARVVVPNQRRLVAAARAAGVEVLYTCIESLTADGRDRSLDHKLSGIHVPRGDPGGRVIDEIAPAGDEIVLAKSSSGVFNSTSIDYVLRNLGVRFLVVVGAMTDQCVDMAVRDGADRGYAVTAVSDACAAETEERHEQALRAFSGYCRIATTGQVLAELRRLG